MSKKMKRVSSEILSGIYKITNIKNNKVYIGSSKDIYGRWLQHKNDLNQNKHHNRYLQFSWNKYGEENFIFKIIELCNDEDLFVNEQKWYDYYNSGNNKYGYNLSKIARCPSYGASSETLKNGDQIITYEQFQKIIYLLENTDISIPKIAKELNAPERTIYQIYFKEQYAELVKNKNFIQRDNHGNSILTEDEVIKIINRLKNDEFNSDIARDFSVSAGTIDDIRQHRTWKKYTIGITFNDISNRKRGRTPKKVIQYSLDGIKIKCFTSAKDAGKSVNINPKIIMDVCSGNKRQCHGYIWRYENDPFDKYDVDSHNCVKIDKYSKDGKYKCTYNSIKEANQSIESGDVRAILNGRVKSAGGYYWCRNGEKFSIPIYNKSGRHKSC